MVAEEITHLRRQPGDFPKLQAEMLEAVPVELAVRGVAAMTADEELVAAELARLDPCRVQQARAEAALLRMLPVAEAAAVLREGILDGLAAFADENAARGWGPYLRLEAAVLRHRGLAGFDRNYSGYLLWRELDLGDEPDPLRWARRLRTGWPRP